MKHLKSILLSTTFCICLYTTAQEDLFTAIAPYADGKMEFMTLDEYRYKHTYTIAKNKFGRNAGLEAKIDHGDGKIKTQEWRPYFDELDHYTHPARYIYGAGNNQATSFIFVDKVLYKIWYCSEGCVDFKIQTILVPLIKEEKKEAAGKSKKKKKGGFMNKLAAKMGKAMGMNAHYMAQNDVDHEARIKDYLQAMKEVQLANPYNAQTKSELAELKADKDKETDEINRVNAEYYNSEEYREIQKRDAFFANKAAEDAKTEVTLKNLTGKIVGFGNGTNMTGGTVNPGATVTVSCEEDIYLYQVAGTTYKKARLVNSSGSNCEGTIDVQ